MLALFTLNGTSLRDLKQVGWVYSLHARWQFDIIVLFVNPLSQCSCTVRKQATENKR